MRRIPSVIWRHWSIASSYSFAPAASRPGDVHFQAQGSQGITQLVGDVGAERPLSTEGRVEPREEIVETVDHRTDFAGACFRDRSTSTNRLPRPDGSPGRAVPEEPDHVGPATTESEVDTAIDARPTNTRSHRRRAKASSIRSVLRAKTSATVRSACIAGCCPSDLGSHVVIRFPVVNHARGEKRRTPHGRDARSGSRGLVPYRFRPPPIGYLQITFCDAR